MKKQFCLLLTVISFVFILPLTAVAGGFAILEQSAEGVGYGFAGAAAGYGDGSSVHFNPAAMSRIEDTKVSAGVHFVIPQAEFTNQGSTIAAALGGTPLAGGNGPDGGETGIVPNFYAIHKLNDCWTAGLGVNAPFGLGTEYSDTWVGRYQAIKSELKTVNITPALSYDFGNGLSFGAGLNVLYADAELSNAIDFGTIAVSRLGLPTASALGLLPQAADGKAVVKGDDWGWGFNLGVAYQYDQNGSRFGLNYKSKIDVTLTGDADFTVPAAAAALTATGAFTDTSASSSVDLPESVAFGIIHNLSDQWSLLGEVMWTNWDRFDELRVKFGNGQQDSVVDESWEDTWRFSGGVKYAASDALTLRGGITYDEEPIPDSAHRTPRIPGNDRLWLALGASYQITDYISADLSYAHLFVNDTSSAVTGSTGEVLRGNWDLAVDIVSLQVSGQFG
ncbi:MAG: aromatic hydrocarbon degradation protein [Candidatus Dadabacteria bacterium]|nr:MAG: aromatic hydrocarbon degradation protein [Candidatus Dadabacteria bacterium]